MQSRHATGVAEVAEGDRDRLENPRVPLRGDPTQQGLDRASSERPVLQGNTVADAELPEDVCAEDALGRLAARAQLRGG